MAKDSKGHGSAVKPGARRADPFASMTARSSGAAVKGFKPPEYPAGGGGTKGHLFVKHKGADFHHTGKTGTHIASGEKSYEYAHKGEKGERRLWVTKSGKASEE